MANLAKTAMLALLSTTGLISGTSAAFASTLADIPTKPANEPAAVITDIIVTAQRFEERLQKTPLAIKVVTADELGAAGVTQTRDLMNVVPGLQIGQAGAATQIYIRGVGDFGSTPITNPAVAFHVDGVYIARSQAVEGNLYDVSRVEVLKGPQGTLYGRNASGGAINLITNRPRLGTTGGFAEFEVGNYDAFKGTGALNLPIGDQLAVRASFQLVSRKGYQTQGADDDKHQSGRLQAYWQSGNVSLLVGGDYTHVGGYGAGYAVFGPARGNLSPWTSVSDPRVEPYFNATAAAQGNCIPAIFFPGVVNPGACPTFAPYPSPPTPPGTFGPYTSISKLPLGRQSQDNEFWRIHAEAKFVFDWATLTIIPAFQHSDVDYVNFPSGATYHAISTSKATSVEARLANSGPRLKWVAGLYYFDEQQDSVGEEFISGLLRNDINNTFQGTRSLAAFGEATVNIADKTRLIAGLRYTNDRRTISGNVLTRYPSINFVPPVPFNPCFAGLPNACLLETFAGRKVTNKVTWKVGAQHDFSPQNMIFATVSTGFKAGGFNQSRASTQATPGGIEASYYRPEVVEAVEFGSRNRFFGDRLQVNLEAFYWRYKDHQEPRITLDSAGVLAFAYQNAGSATSYGLDLDIVAKVSNAGTFHANAEYLHSKYDSFLQETLPNFAGPPFVRGAGNGFTSFDPLSPLAATTGCVTSTITSGPLTGGVRSDCSGFPLTRAPRWSGAVGYDHRLDLAGGFSLTGSVDAQFSSKRYLTADYSPNLLAKGYVALNANLILAAPDKRWSLMAYVRNITNRAIYSGGIQAQFAGFSSANIGAPRTYGLRLRADF